MEEKLPSPSIALAAYAEAFLSGRRVVVFGDSLSGLAEHLVDRGARVVQVYDPQSERVAEATACNTSRHVSFALLNPSGAPSRDGAFDLGIIDDLSSLPDPRRAVALLRQVLSARGVGFVVSANPDLQPRFGHPQVPDATSYYDLYDIVCAEFDEVRMLGQAPFVGFALADFSPESEDEFSIDTSMVPGGAEEPEWYVAVASHFPVACDPFSVVQLPAAQLLQHVNSPRRLRDELRAARQQVEKLEQQLAVVKAAPPPPKPDREVQEQVQVQLREAKLELERRDVWVKELEARAATADARADEAEARIDEAEERAVQAQARATRAEQRVRELEALRPQLAQTQEALQRAHAELEQLRQQQAQRTAREDEERDRRRELEPLRERVERLTEQLTQQEGQDKRLRQDLKAQTTEVLALEKQLIDRGKQVSQLTRALTATERFAEQVLLELEEARELSNGAAGSSGEPIEAQIRKLESQLNGLAQTDAQRVADLTAARWTIAELENKLAGQEALDTSETERELQLARAQLQHQATLLKQYAEKTRV